MVDAFSGGAGLGAGGTTVSLDSGLTGHEPPLFSPTPSPLSFKATSGPRGGGRFQVASPRMQVEGEDRLGSKALRNPGCFGSGPGKQGQ